MAKDPPRKRSPKKRSTRSEPKPRISVGPPDTSSSFRTFTFTLDVLDRTIITPPLLEVLRKGGTNQLYDIIIDINQNYPGGRKEAQARIRHLIIELISTQRGDRANQGVHARKTDMTKQYVFARLRGDLIQKLVRTDQDRAWRARTTEGPTPALHRVWPDFVVSPLTYRSVATVKAAAAHKAFGASGGGVVWAILDSGIDASHPHFRAHRNLELPLPLRHCDFTTFGELSEDESEQAALTDRQGHGTHVAGIIAGELRQGTNERLGQAKIQATLHRRDEHGMVVAEHLEISAISGIAPACKLISFKVLDITGGPVSNLIAACEKIQEINDNGRHIKIHGVNIGVGYDFEAHWFTSGQSPLCLEIDRLVRSGVVVVVAAGNNGYEFDQSPLRVSAAPAGMEMTINDPGNADLAITVGSTHPENPLLHGVSYFSSKGPTADGRLKPDLVAPGETIISCQVDYRQMGQYATDALYHENSGTSVAAAHVSGAIAAFLSVCPEFIGRPEEIKEIFMSNATDLKRAPNFQGQGLVDLFRALSYVRGVTESTMPAGDAAPTREAVSVLRAVGERSKSADDNAPIKVFISYSHADERLRKQLGMHLSLLKRQGVIEEWHDRRISAGQEWVGEIDKHLNSATIILLLVSAAFLASDYCYDREMKRALERHEAGEAVVIPVILRYVNWEESAPFSSLTALPTDGKPVEAWSPRARAFADIAEGIRKVAQELHSARSHARRDSGAVRVDATR